MRIREMLDRAKREANADIKDLCPTLYKFATENGISLDQLRDELQTLLHTIPKDEVQDLFKETDEELDAFHKMMHPQE